MISLIDFVTTVECAYNYNELVVNYDWPQIEIHCNILGMGEYFGV